MPDQSDLPQIRGARLIRTGVIECEIQHPSLGWLPFGAIEGAAGLSGEVYAAAAAEALDVRDAAPDPAPLRAGMSLSRRQLLIGMAPATEQYPEARGWITAEEAIAAATAGAMPAAVEAAIAGLSAADQVAARITWAAMSTARRVGPLVVLLAAARGVSDAEVDAFFTAFANI